MIDLGDDFFWPSHVVWGRLHVFPREARDIFIGDTSGGHVIAHFFLCVSAAVFAYLAVFFFVSVSMEGSEKDSVAAPGSCRVSPSELFLLVLGAYAFWRVLPRRILVVRLRMVRLVSAEQVGCLVWWYDPRYCCEEKEYLAKSLCHTWLYWCSG